MLGTSPGGAENGPMVIGDWRSLPAFLVTLTTVAACDGDIQVQGTVYSNEGQRVPSANVGLYDRRLSDGFDA
jgi:hypothetical protein